MKQPGKVLFISGQFAWCPALNETPDCCFCRFFLKELYIHTKTCMQTSTNLRAGVDPGFFFGGGSPLRNGVTEW